MLKIENVEVMGWEHAIRGMRNPKNSWAKSDSEFHREPRNYFDENDMPCTDLRRFVLGPNDLKLMTTLRNAGTDHRKFMRMITVYLDITAPLYWWKEFDTYKVGTVADSCSTMHKIHAKEFTIDDFSCEHLLSSKGVSREEADRKEYPLVDMSPHNDGSKLMTPLGVLEITIVMLNVCRQRYLVAEELEGETGLSAKDIWWQLIQLLPSSYNQKRTIMLNYEVLANMYKSRKNHKLDEWHTLCDWIETLPYSKLITGNV